MSKHTEGPWTAYAGEDTHWRWIIKSASDDELGSGDGGFEEADAKLMAKAPEMLEMLKEAIVGIDYDLHVKIESLINSRCAYCGKEAQGNYAIHRDGFDLGPEVPLCDKHGSGQYPSCEDIWDRISENKPSK